MNETSRNRTPLAQRLRDATADLADLRTQLPFARALYGHSLPLEAYVCHLQALALIRAPLEEFSGARDPGVRAAWREELAWLPRLKVDLDYLVPIVPRFDDETRAAAEGVARQLRQALRAEPITFLGHLYAQQRVTLDAPLADACAAAAYGLGEAGRVFWRHHVDGAEDRFRSLLGRLDQLVPGGAPAERVLAAARTGMALLISLERTLHPGVTLFDDVRRTPPPDAAERRLSFDRTPGCAVLNGRRGRRSLTPRPSR